jgi:hypothetical protein
MIEQPTALNGFAGPLKRKEKVIIKYYLKKTKEINNRLWINEKEIYTNAEQASQSKKIDLLR